MNIFEKIRTQYFKIFRNKVLLIFIIVQKHEGNVS